MEQAVAAQAVAAPEKKWFVLRVISGKEKKTKEYLDKEILRSKWDNVITQVLVPMEKIYKIKVEYFHVSSKASSSSSFSVSLNLPQCADECSLGI